MKLASIIVGGVSSPGRLAVVYFAMVLLQISSNNHYDVCQIGNCFYLFFVFLLVWILKETHYALF